MKIATIWVVTFLGAMSAGCQDAAVTPAQPSPANPSVSGSAKHGDLFVSIRLPKSRFVTGETLPVVLVAKNQGWDGLRFLSRTSSLYRIQLEALSPQGWEVVREYPESAATVLTEWVLEPGEQRTIEITLVAGRDWPTYENLRLRARLVGREEASPFVHIEITPE